MLEPSAPAVSISAVSGVLTQALDQLEAVLANMQGGTPITADAPLAWGETVLSKAPIEAFQASATLLDTPTIIGLINKTFLCFASPASSDASRPATMSSTGFGKMARAAQLVSERCTQVDIDLIFAKVAKARTARIQPEQMLTALSLIALKLHPEEQSQSSAFHRLLSEHLLPWMVQLDQALASVALSQPPVSTLFERHADFLSAAFCRYLRSPQQPFSAEVAALPGVLLQWAQFVAFAHDFGLCPALASWEQLGRLFCLAGTCASAQDTPRPEAYGVTLAQFSEVVGCSFLLSHQAAPPKPAEPTSPTLTPAYHKSKAGLAHLRNSRGAQQLRQQPHIT